MTDAWELCLDCKDRGGDASVPAPQLCIVLFTYRRTEMAVRTINGIAEKLDYPKELVSFYVADDGSPSAHMDAVLRAIVDGGYKVAGNHNQKIYYDTPFCGVGWNAGVRKAYQVSDYIMLLEDDWVLNASLDIRPYIWMLMEKEEVGMVRLSGLTTDNILRVRAHRGVHYLEYLRSGNFCYSGNPHIRHLRFTQYYGLFGVNLSPGDIEVHYDQKYHRMPGGPVIWRPADLPAWGIFSHVGCERTW